MADYERAILEFYQLPTLYPTEWAASGDASDTPSDDEAAAKKQWRRSPYRALESAVHERRSFPGGVGSFIAKDEPDPLGSSDSVLQSLKDLGVPVQDDPRLRNRFLLSSTTFSPALYLSQMHAEADTQSLLNGLDLLSKSIDQKSASLKALVETNFERFVRAKATIDNVYREMKFRGIEPHPPRNSRHSRHPSRTSYRSSAGAASLQSNPTQPSQDSRKKNALVKESEYGLIGIKIPLLDVSAKAEDVWGPALGGREKEEHLKNVSLQLTQFKDYVELSSTLSEAIKRRDYESLVDIYNLARKFADEARSISQKLGGRAPDDAQLYQILIAGRMWHDVDQQIQSFKRDVWKKLISLHSVSRSEQSTGRSQDQPMDIVNLLLDLGVPDNPILAWLLSRHDHLRGKIHMTAERSRVEIEAMRRRLAVNEKPSPLATASHLRTLGQQPIESKASLMDSPDVIELWEKTVSFLTNLLSPQGILGELVDYWQTAQSFISGKAQKNLPVGYQGESRPHHKLPQKAVIDLKKGFVALVDLVRDHVHTFFAGPPPEDMSLLFSPIPPSPNSPPSTASLRDGRLNLDPGSLPPPSPKRGEPWENLAFWPPWSNSISASHYLAQMLALVGSGASEMASLGPVASGDSLLLDSLKSLVGVSRERSAAALCTAWNRDAENIKYVEDWERPPDSIAITRMPLIFSSFESTLLSGMQKILYFPDAMGKAAGDIVTPPPQKLLNMVKSQYTSTLYKALSGMVENAERSTKHGEDEWTTTQDSWEISVSGALLPGRARPGSRDRNVRMLLTLSDLQAVRSQVVPSLNSQFENAFSAQLTDESTKIRDVLGQIDARLFSSYTKQTVDKLGAVISRGLSSPDWAPTAKQRPESARPYVYEVLLALVFVHSQVSTTAPSLAPKVLSFLLEQASQQLLEGFQKRPRYTLEALMQATLDVEFVAQTLNHYTTDRASELQGQIYQELDARSDEDARSRLQFELPEMRSVLKRLREASRNEFACFKKPKRHAHGAERADG